MSDISEFTKISQAAVAASDIWGVLKYHELVFIPNTPKKPCCLLVMLRGKEITGVIFACKFFKFGLNTTGLSPSHFRNFSAGIINAEIFVPKLRSNQVPFFYNRVWNVHTGEMLNTLFHHCEAVLHLRFQDGMMVTCSKVTIKVRFFC